MTQAAPNRRERGPVGERATLEAFLDDYRDMVVRKVSGLGDADARRRLVASQTMVGGLVKHLRWAEYGWFDQLLSQRVDDNRRTHERSWEFAFTAEESLATLVAEYRAALLRHLNTSGLLTEPPFEALRRQLYTRVNTDTDTTWGRVEPGWNDRKVELPRLISKWLEIVFSARTAAMLQPYDLMWPQDVLEDFMAGQRAAPGSAVERSREHLVVVSGGHSNVVALPQRGRRG